HGRELERFAVGAAPDRVDQILRARESGGLDQEAVGSLRGYCAGAVHKAFWCRATDTPARNVRDPERLALGQRDLVERGLAEVVDSGGDGPAFASLELGADRRRLARTEKSRDDLDRNLA